MLPASYQFAGLDAEMMELTQELENLGGGDARSVAMELHYLIKRSENERSQTLWRHENSVGLRDIYAKDPSVVKSMRYFAVNSSSTTEHPQESFSSSETINTIVEENTKLLMEGFNGCILSVGPSLTGKTETLFGNIGHNQFENDELSNNSLSAQILRKIYDHKKKFSSDFEYRLGLSAWSFDGQRNIDLMIRVAETNMPLEFTVIECPTIEVAVQVLNEARKRCIGALSANPAIARNRRNEEEKCHFFARIMLFQRDLHAIDRGTASIHAGITSSLYIVDLLGSTDIDSNYYKTLPNKDKIVVRNRNIQLQSLLQLLQEMASISRNALQHPSQPMEHMKRFAKLLESKALTSARSSKLSKLLAPILQGNTRTMIMGFLVDGEEQYEHTRDLMTQLQYIPEIRSAVYRMEDIPFHDLNFKSHLTVLGPRHSHQYSHQGATRNTSFSNSGLIFTSAETKPIYQPIERIADQFETIAFSSGGRIQSHQNDFKERIDNDFNKKEENQKEDHPVKRVSAQEINLTNLLEEGFDLTNFDRTPQSASTHTPSRRTIMDTYSKEDSSSSSSSHLEDDIQRLVPEPNSRQYIQNSLTADPRSEIRSHGFQHEGHTEPNIYAVDTTYVSGAGRNTSTHSNGSVSSIQHLMDEFHSLMHVVETSAASPPNFIPLTTNTLPQMKAGSISQEHNPFLPPKQQHLMSTQTGLSSTNSPFQHNQSQNYPERLSTTLPLRQISSSPSRLANSVSIPTTSTGKYQTLVQESEKLFNEAQKPLESGYPLPRSLVSSLEMPSNPLRNSYNIQEKQPTKSPNLHLKDRLPDFNQPPQLWSQLPNELHAQIPMGIGAQTAEMSVNFPPQSKNVSPNRFSRKSIDNHQKVTQNFSASPIEEEGRYSRVVSAADDIIRRNSRNNSPSHHTSVERSSTYNKSAERKSTIATLLKQYVPPKLLKDFLKTDRQQEIMEELLSSDPHESDREEGSVDSLHDVENDYHYQRTSQSEDEESSSYYETSPGNKEFEEEKEVHSKNQREEMPSSISSADDSSHNQEAGTVNSLKVSSSIQPKIETKSVTKHLESSENYLSQSNACIAQHREDKNIPRSSLLHVRLSKEATVDNEKAPTSISDTENKKDKRKPSILSLPQEEQSTLHSALTVAQEEIENLMRVKESLILALQNEKAHRMRLEKETQQLRDGYVEVHAQHEVEIDSLRYHVQHLRSQVKKLCEQGACLDVFEAFEKDVLRLTRENEMLRETNLKLEWQLLEEDTRMENVEVSTVSLADIVQASTDEEKDVLERRRRLQQQWSRNATKQKTLMERLKMSGKERENWKQEYEKLKIKERQFIVAEKLKEDTSRRLKKAVYDLQVAKKESDQRSVQLLEMERQNNILKHDLEQFQKSDELLRVERDRLLSEVAELRTKIRFFEAEDQRVAKLNKFVSKHSNVAGNSYSRIHNENISGGGINMSGGNIASRKMMIDRPPLRHYSQPAQLSRPKEPSTSNSNQQPVNKNSSISKANIDQSPDSLWLMEGDEALNDDLHANYTPSLLPMFQQLAANTRFK